MNPKFSIIRIQHESPLCIFELLLCYRFVLDADMLTPESDFGGIEK